MPNVSIRARLIFLSVLLLAILVVSSALLIRELARDLRSLAEEATLVSVVRNANSASKHFGDLKYWVIDSAVTQLARSQQAAERRQGGARLRSEGDLRGRSGGRHRHRTRSRHHDRSGEEGWRRLFERRQRRRQRPAGTGQEPHSRYRQRDRQDRGPDRAAGRGPARRVDAPGANSPSSSRSSAELARCCSRWASPR